MAGGVRLPTKFKRAATTAPKVAEDVKTITEEVVEAPEDFFEEALEEEAQDAPGASGVELPDETDNRSARLDLIAQQTEERRRRANRGAGTGAGTGAGQGTDRAEKPPLERSGEFVFAAQGKRPPSSAPYQSASVYQQTPDALDRRRRLEDIAKLQELRERGLLTPEQQMEAVAKMDQTAADQKKADEAEMTAFEVRQRAAEREVARRRGSADPRVFAADPEQSRGGVFAAPGIPKEVAEDPKRLAGAIKKLRDKKVEYSNRRADLDKLMLPAKTPGAPSILDFRGNQPGVIEAIARLQSGAGDDAVEDRLSLNNIIKDFNIPASVLEEMAPGGVLTEKNPRLRAGKLAQVPGEKGVRLRELQGYVNVYVARENLTAQEKAVDILLGELIKLAKAAELVENEAASAE